MSSTLGMAILTLLSREPLTGYEISRSMKGPIRFFWQVAHSQVYPELARLEKEALVTHERAPGPGKPNQKRYSLTGAGRKALKAWLVGPLEETPKRSELCLRAYGIAQADPRRAKALFQKEAGKHRAWGTELDHHRSELELSAGSTLEDHRSQAFADYAVLMRGIAFERANAEWCAWMAERLNA